jgi:hypothetical protein
VVALLVVLRAFAAITRYGVDPRDRAIMSDGGSGQPDEEGHASDEQAYEEDADESDGQEAPEPQFPVAASLSLGASSIAEGMPQPGQLPTWWDPVHLVSTAPEAGLIDTVANSDPASLRAPSDPAQPLPPGPAPADEVGDEDQHDAVTWPGVLNVLAAIGRLFIRDFTGE